MSNTGYRDGYNVGYSHGKNGSPKDSRKIGLVNGVLKGSKYVDEWMKGYNIGYLDGLRASKN